MPLPVRPLPDRLKRVERYVRWLVKNGPMPHAQFLAARDGDILHQFCVGEARDDGRALQPHAIYRIASMTKAVTAVLFMMLVEERRVSLDDPMAKILPELADLVVHIGGEQPPFQTRPAKRQPMMIDLLRHTAGLTYGIQQHSPVDKFYWKAGLHNFKACPTRNSVLADLAALPLVDDPGSHFTYSMATDVLGLAAERITGRGLGELFEERIFAPLGMIDTGFHAPPEKLHRFTDSWAMIPGKGKRLYDPAEGGLWSRPPSYESGGGGLVSTAVDYLRFGQMLLGEGPQMLRPETIALMTRNHLPDGGSIGKLSRSMFGNRVHRFEGHGLGFAVTLPGGKGVPPEGEFHWGGLFGTWFSIVPSERLIAIFMTQLIPASDESFANRILKRLYR